MKKIISKIKEYGFAGFIKYAFRKLLGIQQQQEEIDTLYYFLNKYNDITKLPPTDNKDLRILQKCDAVMLAIFDKLCKKHDLTYWLAYGTLLGAVRHGGFIPWDDDLDICMPRKDYDRVIEILKPELQSMGFSIYEKDNETYRICLEYKHYETGIWCDIFPVEEICSDENIEQFTNTIRLVVSKYRHLYLKNNHKGKDFLKKQRQKFFCFFGDNTYNVSVVDATNSRLHINEKNIIYPLKRSQFENFEINIPADSDKVLTLYFGKDYMSFPHNGIEHHGNQQGLLSEWAIVNNVNMYQIYEKLILCYTNIQ